VLVDEAAEVILVPAGAGEQLGMLGPERDAGADRLVDERAGPPDRVGEVARKLLGTVVCRASMWMTERIVIAVTVLA
jgi:hypothetical protein